MSSNTFVRISEVVAAQRIGTDVTIRFKQDPETLTIPFATEELAEEFFNQLMGPIDA